MCWAGRWLVMAVESSSVGNACSSWRRWYSVMSTSASCRKNTAVRSRSCKRRKITWSSASSMSTVKTTEVWSEVPGRAPVGRIYASPLGWAVLMMRLCVSWPLKDSNSAKVEVVIWWIAWKGAWVWIKFLVKCHSQGAQASRAAGWDQRQGSMALWRALVSEAHGTIHRACTWTLSSVRACCLNLDLKVAPLRFSPSIETFPQTLRQTPQPNLKSESQSCFFQDVVLLRTQEERLRPKLCSAAPQINPLWSLTWSSSYVASPSSKSLLLQEATFLSWRD